MSRALHFVRNIYIILLSPMRVSISLVYLKSLIV